MENKLQQKLRDDYKYFSKNQRILVDCLLDNKCKNKLTISELAQEAFCSPSSVTKFIKKLGFSSYKVFLNELYKDTIEDGNNMQESFTLVDNIISDDTEVFTKLVDLFNGNWRVYIAAVGTSTIPVYNLEQKIKNLHIDSEFIFMLHSNDIDSKYQHITTDDYLVLFSNSGNSVELLKLVEKVNPNKTFLITNRANNKLVSKVDVMICLGNTMESEFKFENNPRESIYTLIYFTDILLENIIKTQ